MGHRKACKYHRRSPKLNRFPIGSGPFDLTQLSSDPVHLGYLLFFVWVNEILPSYTGIITLLMEEIPANHLGCTQPCK